MIKIKDLNVNSLTFIVGIGYPYGNNIENMLTICSRKMIDLRIKHSIVFSVISSSVIYKILQSLFQI